jgi:hypothetical protein
MRFRLTENVDDELATANGRFEELYEDSLCEVPSMHSCYTNEIMAR